MNLVQTAAATIAAETAQQRQAQNTLNMITWPRMSTRKGTRMRSHNAVNDGAGERTNVIAVISLVFP